MCLNEKCLIYHNQTSLQNKLYTEYYTCINIYIYLFITDIVHIVYTMEKVKNDTKS